MRIVSYEEIFINIEAMGGRECILVCQKQNLKRNLGLKLVVMC